MAKKIKCFVWDGCGSLCSFVDLTEKQYEKYSEYDRDPNIFVMKVDEITTISYKELKDINSKYEG